MRGPPTSSQRCWNRDPAAHVSLDNPIAVTYLLDTLHEVGATGQVTALATRAAAGVSLDNPESVTDTHLKAVTSLLDKLREAGALTQAAALIERLPAAGLFQLFCQQEGREDQFRFGRDADGRPAKLWAWADLG
jgi:hypothetical protein